jgi:hypothetical protein
MKRIGAKVAETAEALINGQRSAGDIRELLRKAIRDRARMAAGVEYVYVYLVDHTADAVVYCASDDAMWQCSYTINGDIVALGEPFQVVPAYVPAPAAETTVEGAELDRHVGRVLEALDPDAATGGRRYRVQVIAYGDSRNGRRYPAKVMRAAASLYEGAKAYDHHRTTEELATGTIAGLVGYYRNVKATGVGLEADLHLLPSATHAAEALDAALAGVGAPMVGISHDVQATFRPIVVAGREMAEATQIVRVLSADIVSDPAAGGAAIRAVAGGVEPTDPAGAPPASETEESDVTVTTEGVLAALQTATDEQIAAVRSALAGPQPTTEAVTPPAVEPATETAPPAGEPKGSFLAGLMIRAKIEEAGLAAAREAITAALPERITEADVDTQVAAYKAVLAGLERGGLVPTAAATVTREDMDKRITRLDNFFSQNWREGYHSFRQAYVDITGHQPRSWDEDLNRRILRESFGHGFDSGLERAGESLDSTSWAQVLGDSVTRRVVAEYNVPALQTWRAIVSSIVPVMDFRTQRVGRVGGYGVLPTVLEGGPYQPLTSPGDEEATYALAKKGGTEDITIEMIANDDRQRISTIPRKLGRAAAQTLYRFVWDFFTANAATTYDSVAWFHSSHGNTASSAALSQTTLTNATIALMDQTAYGDSSEVLGSPAKFLVVPNELRELAFQLTTSAVAIPSTPASASDSPNIHAQLDHVQPIVVPYWTDANDWFAIADPKDVPTLEVGFYNGREEPELFTQSDPNVGSVFNSDTFTWKVRFIFSGTVLDHRGVYRGQG